jgi:hypothetical protein
MSFVIGRACCLHFGNCCFRVLWLGRRRLQGEACRLPARGGWRVLLRSQLCFDGGQSTLQSFDLP